MSAPTASSELVISELPTTCHPGPARLWYRWVMLGLTILCMIATFPGQTIGISAFNEPMRSALALSHSQFASAYMLGTLLGALPLTLLGGLADRHGMKKGILVGLLGVIASCLIAATARSWFAVFIAFWLMRMLGAGFLSLMSTNTLAFWFDRSLGMAEGLRQLGFACAIAVVPAANLFFIDQFGWRLTWMGYGLGVAGIILPAIGLLYRNRTLEEGPTDSTERSATSPKTGLTASQARRTGAYWGITFLCVWWGLLGTAIAFNAVPLMTDRGLRESDGALLLQAFAISLAVTNLIAGFLIDRVAPHWLLTASVFCTVGTAMLLTMVTGPVTVICAGACMGVGQACSVGLASVLCARYFGRAHLGAIRGSISSSTVAFSSLGPLLFGVMYDSLGGYREVLLLSAVISFGGLLAVAMIRQPRLGPTDAAGGPGA